MSAEHDRAGVAETHISVVFFAGDRAYKLLKPITLGFLDHAPRAARLAAAERELELNRRMAPDVYLGLAEVTEGTEVVDRMIVMRRMPTDRRLSALIDSPELADHLRSIARTVAAFHAQQPPVADASMATRDAVLANWEDSFTDMERFVGPVLHRGEFDEVVERVRRYLGPRRAVFEERISEGMVRDGHGDLLADDIFCLDDGPRILDCLAFRDDLRISDVLCDVAFLAMDLDRLAGADAARQFMGWYREFSNEHHPSSLAHHYVAYRAHVRAKVECLRLEQDPDTTPERARAYHDLARRHLDLARVRLVLVGGGPGAGKSTLGALLADTLGATHLQSDERRKDLLGLAHDEHAHAQPFAGAYTPEMTDRTYAELLRDAELLLARGDSVILDASWSDEPHREAARAAAQRWSADLTEIECVLDPDEARERIAHRLATTSDPSDATPELVDELVARRAPWPEATVIDTGGSFDELAATAPTLLA